MELTPELIKKIKEIIDKELEKLSALNIVEMQISEENGESIEDIKKKLDPELLEFIEKTIDERIKKYFPEYGNK